MERQDEVDYGILLPLFFHDVQTPLVEVLNIFVIQIIQSTSHKPFSPNTCSNPWFGEPFARTRTTSKEDNVSSYS